MYRIQNAILKNKGMKNTVINNNVLKKISKNKTDYSILLNQVKKSEKKNLNKKKLFLGIFILSIIAISFY
jgi:hypothetical protein